MQNILFLVKKYWKELALLLLIIVAIFIAVYSIYLQKAEAESTINMEVALQDNFQDEMSGIINVDVKGAVTKPGVYQVESGAIVNDVILLAEGFTKNAYQNGINLSKRVTDEMVIYVYTTSEIKAANKTEVSINTCVAQTYDICNCTEKQESIIETGTTANNDANGTTSEAQDDTANIVNINTAGVSELTSISGIGEAKAEAIIEYRNTNGNFLNITDLLNVSGIGEALFAKIKDFITI